MSEPNQMGKVLKDYPAGNLPLAENPPFRQPEYALYGGHGAAAPDPARDQQSAMRHTAAGNLDLHVHVLEYASSGGSLSEVSDHYLVWRNGDYIGKYDLAADIPGGLIGVDGDSDDVTYINFA